jgi:transglutaminase-like putative cysteine protease
VIYEVAYPTPMQFVVRAQDDTERMIVAERFELNAGELEHVHDAYGNSVARLLAPAGTLRLRYDAAAMVPATPDPTLPELGRTPVEALPGEAISYLWPSRYCPSDRLIDEAWRRFGHVQGGWNQVQAVCDWLKTNITYGSGSTSATDSLEALEARRGVCRDFAHLGVTFCRALNIPARYVCGYLPDIGVPPDPAPMDFHAWFEAYLDGAWRTFDARHNIPRTGRVVIARGRDAVDGAWATVFGAARLVRLKVWADEVPADFALARLPQRLEV